MSHATRAGDVLADRYRLVDLLSESGGGRFWRAHDQVLERHVALHVIDAADPRAELLLDAAKQSARVLDPRLLRVLDAVRTDRVCFVVNEWGSGSSLDIMLATHGPLSPRSGAWMVAEAADAMAVAHAAAVTHGRLVPENLLVDTTGAVKLIGLCVDAALHGLPPAEAQQDVIDLAGLLEATLTGRWAGRSASAVPRVPTSHGRVLRPRQVRAGVPRALDDLCDEVLNPRGARVRDVHNVGSARGIHTLLAEYVGDPAGLAEAIAAANPERQEVVDLPAVPEIVAREDPDDVRPGQHRAAPDEPDEEHADAPDDGPDDGHADAPDDEPDDEQPDGRDAQQEPEQPGQPEQPEPGQPTQAGMPIFHDEDDEVSWLRTRSDPSPPPPPFEEPPERPLFAPEPSDGGPARRPRFPAPTHGPVPGVRGEAHWPFETGPGATGSGVIPAVDDQPTGDEPVPGRGWLRAAALVAVVLLLVVAVAITVNLSRGKTALGEDPDDATAPTTPAASASRSSAPYTALTGLTATDLDPQGDPPEENPDEVGNAVDGDPATSWQTSTYRQQLGPGGIKQGVGLVLDLGRSVAVRRVELTMVGEPTDVSLYLSSERPTGIDGLKPVASLTADAGAVVTLARAVPGRYLTVWLTSLPTADGGFRGGVAEVVVDR